MRRGFKSEVEKIAIEIRNELGLSLSQPLNAYSLADHLGIPIVKLNDLRDQGASKTSIRQLTGRGRGEFSAVSVFDGTRCLIVVNESHAPTRLSNTITHELSHLILGHEPSSPIGMGGCRKWDEVQEDEANWLAGELLVPRVTALAIARRQVDVKMAARRLGISEKLLKWRLNHSGASKQAERERANRRF